MNFERTNSESVDFQQLIKLLNQDIWNIAYDDQSKYDQQNIIENNNTVVVVYENDSPIGCGCFKKFDETTIEIKRMYIKPEFRAKGIAAKILIELESWAREKGFSKSILETGNRQLAAIALYKKMGYEIIPKFGIYVELKDSVCFGKSIS